MMRKLFRSSHKKNEEKLFLKNGGIFLKKLIADYNDISILIRNFSSSQILKATNNFVYSYLLTDKLVYGAWYKGIIEDKPYLIKKFNRAIHGDVYNDIVLSARMNNHNNFLKLIGCCFEFSLPVVVFEYEELATMNHNGRIMVRWQESILPWSVRLKIAKEVAIAVTYLHTASSRIIIHRNITLENIFLDKNRKAKLINFMHSESLPEGKTRITNAGFGGFFNYTYLLFSSQQCVSEYTDVYSFGLCLLVFLTGKSPFGKKGRTPDIVYFAKNLYENERLDEVIDPAIAKDITSDQRLQVEAFVVLALRCCEEREEDTPKMIQVAKELKRIERMEQSVDASSAIRFPKHEILEDGPSVVKSTWKLKLD